ncbi:MAG: hypothetical protein QXU98_11735 [Candidatus Parvarchaeota archaeon]
MDVILKLTSKPIFFLILTLSLISILSMTSVSSVHGYTTPQNISKIMSNSYISPNSAGSFPSRFKYGYMAINYVDESGAPSISGYTSLITASSTNYESAFGVNAYDIQTEVYLSNPNNLITMNGFAQGNADEVATTIPFQTIYTLNNSQPGNVKISINQTSLIIILTAGPYQATYGAYEIPSALNCSAYLNTNGGSEFQTDAYLCYSTTSAPETILLSGNTSADSYDANIAILKANYVSYENANFNFSSTFSYIAPLNTIPYCAYEYSYLPNTYLNGHQIHPIASNSSYANYTEYPFIAIPYGVSPLPRAPYISVVNTYSGNLTIPYTNIELSSTHQYATNLNTDVISIYSAVNKSFNINDSLSGLNFLNLSDGQKFTMIPDSIGLFGYTYQNNNDSLYPLISTNYTNDNKTIYVSNKNPIELQIQYPIPLLLQNTSDFSIKKANLILATGSTNNRLRYVSINKQKTTNAYASLTPSITSIVNYPSTNAGYRGEYIVFEYNISNLTLMQNSSGLTSGILSAYAGLTIQNFSFNMSYPNGFYTYTYSTPSLPSNISLNFTSTQPDIIELNNQHFYATKLNLSSNREYYIPSPSLSWTYTSNAVYTLSFKTYLNGNVWTSNSKLEYNGVNYSIGSNGLINIPSVASNSIFNFEVFYTANNQVISDSGSLETPVFNPCDPIYQYYYTNSISYYANSTIVSKTTNTNSSTIVSNSTSSSSSSSSSPKSPAPSLKNLMTGIQTAFGMSFLNVGVFSFTLTSGFLYLVVGLVVFGLTEYYIGQKKKNTLIGLIVFAVWLLIGMMTLLIPLFISVLVLLIIGVILGLNFKRLIAG